MTATTWTRWPEVLGTGLTAALVAAGCGSSSPRAEPSSVPADPAPAVEIVDGERAPDALYLEEASVHTGDLTYDPELGDWWPVQEVLIPYHHALRIAWTDPEGVLDRDTDPVRVTFRVDRVERWKVPDRYQWRTEAFCTVLCRGACRP